MDNMFTCGRMSGFLHKVSQRDVPGITEVPSLIITGVNDQIEMRRSGQA